MNWYYNWLYRYCIKKIRAGNTDRGIKSMVFVKSVVEKKEASYKKSSPHQFRRIVPQPQPQWLDMIHLLNCNLAIVYYADKSIEPRILLIKQDRTPLRQLIKDICNLAVPGFTGAEKPIETVATMGAPWENYASTLFKYIDALSEGGLPVHPSLAKKAAERKEALDSHGKTDFNIWDIVLEFERTGECAKYFPITTEKYEQFVCHDGVYRYFPKTGRVMKKQDDGEWKSKRRPKNIKKFQKVKQFEKGNGPQTLEQLQDDSKARLTWGDVKRRAEEDGGEKCKSAQPQS